MSVSGGIESLPAQLALHTTGQMIGVTALAGGKLLVGNKPLGRRSLTLLSIFDGTTPVREYIYHPWFAHAAMKAVPSATMPDRFYLARSDNSESDPFLDHIMDLYEPVTAPEWPRRRGRRAGPTCRSSTRPPTASRRPR